ncbi:LysR family transcriptional regulator [Vibrio sp. F74]|uniref:LysR family transcriptional regulator n=1 Tax=Vibrio sp. F74 TaxID=700020 RepID=UPI0035F5BB15
MLRHLANHLPYFSAVAKHLSFSNAAIELAVSQSSISYQIKCLEEKLGFKLFIRGQGSKVELTSKGNKLFQEYVVLERNFNQVVSDTKLNKNRTKLEMTAPVDLGVKLLTPTLSQLEMDKLIINLDLTDSVVDFKKSKFDFAIRINTDESGLEYLPLLEAKNLLLCSKRYALENQLSQFEQINEHHRLIVRNSERSNTWEKLFLQHGRSFHKHKNMQVINNSFAIYQAIIADTGVGILPEYFVDQTNYQDLYIFKENLNETPFYLTYQPSYVAKKWALQIKENIIKALEQQQHVA